MVQYCDYLRELFNLNVDNMESQIWKVLDDELNLPQDLEEKNISLYEASNKYQEVLDEIASVKTDRRDAPYDDVIIESVTIEKA
jgi:hypothetical protein